MADDVLIELRAISATLKALLLATQQAKPTRAGELIASNRDLDGKFGDPELRFDPRGWGGDSFKGRPFSECPADLLDLVAETYEYFAEQSDEKKEVTAKGKPVSDFKRMDAARARGWAARIRSGVHVPPAPAMPATEWAGEDDIPF